ncbi:MAG TPA: sodium:solute symporter family protein [Gaiellaceae bacterium]|jgi:cation/acetate symporter|nr:sodium:solute symporter family protein [Gaiellaceae bacterium]
MSAAATLFAISDIRLWAIIFVVLTFSIYIAIAVISRARSTSQFYVAEQSIPAPANGAAIAADWMSAASFISMAGLISFLGFDGAIYLLGWTGGYVLLALLLAPYLRKYGKYTVPDFIGDRYSDLARFVAVFAAIFVSFTYVAGQMRGVGIVFSRFVGVSITVGVIIGMAVVFVYAVLGGMKGITWTQVAQYTILIIAYLIPAWAITAKLTDIPVPQVSFGKIAQELNELQAQFGLSEYTAAFTSRPWQDVFLVTLALMVGTAGLPHIIIRFYTTKSVRAARWSAGYALLFIAILYTTAPAVAVYAKTNLLQDAQSSTIQQQPQWVDTWEETGLITIQDQNGNGRIDTVSNTEGDAEMLVDPDIMVLANPEIAGLPAPVVGLVAAGGLAAALSTAAGLLLVIGAAVGHDLFYKAIKKDATEGQRLLAGRIGVGLAILAAGYFGVNPPGFVGQVVAFAFGLAAASFFPAIVLGIFWKRANAPGAIAGLVTGLGFTAAYMIATIYGDMEPWFGISPEAIGAVGMAINFIVTIAVSSFTREPSPEIQALVEEVRHPRIGEDIAPTPRPAPAPARGR